MCVRNAETPWTGIIRRHSTLKRKLSVSLQKNIPQERNADGNPSPWKALWRNSGNGLYYMRNYIQTDTVRISAIYLRTGGTPEIAHYATEWMVTVIPFITSSGEVGKKRGFTSKLGYLYPSSSQDLHTFHMPLQKTWHKLLRKRCPSLRMRSCFHLSISFPLS